MAKGRLRVSVLGPFDATCDGVVLERCALQQRAVLVLLALQAGRPVPVERLIDDLWGETPPASARNTVQQYVRRWRRAFEDAGVDSTVELGSAGYILDVDPADVDVLELGRLVCVGREALKDGRHAAAFHAFRQAQTLVRGDPLQDFTDFAFYRTEYPRLDELRVAMAEGRIDSSLALGQGSELVGDLEDLVTRYPYKERFWAQMMHALYRTGRQVEAMRAFDRARQTLADAGLSPGPTLRAMERAVLDQAPELESRASPFSPTPPPVPLTTLIGRTDEVAVVVAGLRETNDRLVTLTGPGGVGKTRFGIEAATRVADEGWSPVAYVALSNVTDPMIVGSFINGAFGVPDSWRERPVREVARMLGTSPLLLVIDGVEHLMETVRDVVTDLLLEWPLLKVLLTSRVALDVRGERQAVVRPLSSRIAGAKTTQELRHAPAVALFIDRCERAGEVLAFTDEELTSIVGICERVDGLPLAIELAAARSWTLGVVGLYERLGASLDLVANPGRGEPDRHGSLRRVLEWSYGLLDSQSRVLLARLSVFAGGFTIEHVEQMWCDEDAGQLLGSYEELDRNSLLARVPGAAQRRFRLLDTVAEFAREKLEESGESVDAHWRLIRWIRQRVAAAGGLIGAGAAQFERLEPEVDNARAAAAWMLDNATPDEAAQFCTELYVWWMYCSRRTDLGALLARSVELGPTSDSVRATVLLQLGRIEAQGAHSRTADEYLSGAAEILRALDDRATLASALTTMAENAAVRSDFVKAWERLNEATDLQDGVDDPQLSCRLLSSCAFIEMRLRDQVAARGTVQTLIASARTLQWAGLEAKALALLGELDRAAGDLDMSRENLHLAIERALSTQNLDALEYALGNMALTRACSGDYESTLDYGVKCLACVSESERDPWAIMRVAAGVVLVTRGEHDAETHSLALELLGAVTSAYEEVQLAEANMPDRYSSLLTLERLGTFPATENGVQRLAKGLLANLLPESSNSLLDPQASVGSLDQ